MRERILAAHGSGRPLRLRGHGSKDFYGGPLRGDILPLTEHAGIVKYEPTELVITARGGTPLEEVGAALGEHRQRLPFDPPRFGGGGTLGGAVAAGLAGPGRPWDGAPRDALLGIRLLDGRGREMHFGGEVMKNVAGYDVARLNAGAMGTLGVLLELSLKVLPDTVPTHTLVAPMTMDEALDCFAEIGEQPLPLRGACHVDGRTCLRIACSERGLETWRRRLPGAFELLEQESDFWSAVRDQRHPFFTDPRPLWRLSLPPNARLPHLGPVLIDWGGAQRWVFSDADGAKIRHLAASVGGEATLFRGGDRSGPVFHPLPPPLLALQQRVQAVFDPKGIFNRGRLFPEES